MTDWIKLNCESLTIKYAMKFSQNKLDDLHRLEFPRTASSPKRQRGTYSEADLSADPRVN